MILSTDIVEIHVPVRIMPRIWDDAEQASIIRMGCPKSIAEPG